MNTTLIAIDPGANGAVIFRHRDSIEVHKMPETEHDLSNLIDSFIERVEADKLSAAFSTTENSDYRIRAYVERVSGYVGGRGQPGSSGFTFGVGFGIIRGVLAHAKLRFELPTPQKWQRALSIPPAGTIRWTKDMGSEQRKLIERQNAKIKRAHKNRMKAMAQQLFPTIPKITLDTCDALLILEYAMRQEQPGHATLSSPSANPSAQPTLLLP